MDIEIVQDVSAKAPQIRVAAHRGFAGAADAFAAKLLSLAGLATGPLPDAPVCGPVGAAPDLGDDQPDSHDPPTDSAPVPDPSVLLIGPDLATLPPNPLIVDGVADYGAARGVDLKPCRQMPDAAPSVVAMPIDGQPRNDGAEGRVVAPVPDGPTPAPRQLISMGDGFGSGAKDQGVPDGPADATPRTQISQQNGMEALAESRSLRSASKPRPVQSDDQTVPSPLLPSEVAAEMKAPEGAGALATQGIPDGTLPSERQNLWAVAPSRHNGVAVAPIAFGSGDRQPSAKDIGMQPALAGGSHAFPEVSHQGETFAQSTTASEVGGDSSTANTKQPARLSSEPSVRALSNPKKSLTDPQPVGAAPPSFPQFSAEPNCATAAEHIAHRPLPLGIAHQLAVNISHHPGREVEITLSPEELGKVRMTVSAAEGTLTLTLTADRADTLDLLRRHINQLAQDFRDLGFDRLNFSFSQDRKDGGHTADGQDTPADAGPTHPSLPAPVHPRPPPQAPLSGGLDIRL